MITAWGKLTRSQNDQHNCPCQPRYFHTSPSHWACWGGLATSMANKHFCGSLMKFVRTPMLVLKLMGELLNIINLQRFIVGFKHAHRTVAFGIRLTHFVLLYNTA